MPIYGAAYEFEYALSVGLTVARAVDLISTGAATLTKRSALNNRVSILEAIARRIEALMQADGDFRNDQGLISWMRPAMEGLFVDAYAPEGTKAGFYQGFENWAGAWLAQELVKDTRAVRTQVFQASLLAVVAEVLNNQPMTTMQQQAVIDSVLELGKTYAWLNQNARFSSLPQMQDVEFLDQLWQLQLPNQFGRFSYPSEAAMVLQRAVDSLDRLLADVHDPARAIQFLNNLLLAATNVPALKDEVKDPQFIQKLLEFAKLNPNLNTSIPTEGMTDAFLDILWKNDTARMKLAERDLSEFFEVLHTPAESTKGLEFGRKLLKLSTYIQEPTLELYKQNSQFLTELIKLGSAYTSLNPVAPTSNQSLDFFLDTAYRLNDLQTSAQQLGNFLKVVTNPDAVLYTNSEQLKKLKVITDEGLQDAKTSNEFIQKLMRSSFSVESSVLYSRAEKFRVRDYQGIKNQTNPLALVTVDEFIAAVEKVEAAWSNETTEDIITRIRRLYYPGSHGWNFLKGMTQKEAFDKLLPDAPNYYYPTVFDYDDPAGDPIERVVDRSVLRDDEAYAILTAKADENGIRDNPSPYIFVPGRNEMIDIGHVLLTLDALLHPRSESPYVDYGVPTIDPASWVADVGIGAVWMQGEGGYEGYYPKRLENIRLDLSEEQKLDEFYKASAPEADILGDVDGFGLFDRFNTDSRRNKPLSVHLKEYYRRIGDDVGFSYEKRWNTFANSYQIKQIRDKSGLYDGTFDIDELTEETKTMWVNRIDNFNNLFGDGGVRATLGLHKNWEWSYTRAMFNRFLAYTQDQLNKEPRIPGS